MKSIFSSNTNAYCNRIVAEMMSNKKQQTSEKRHRSSILLSTERPQAADVVVQIQRLN